eukprot:m.387731 g.387731  ORF g.387731 m.387731 type:complete len:57 (+) comp21036_c0_seq2:1343-1513(+)
MSVRPTARQEDSCMHFLKFYLPKDIDHPQCAASMRCRECINDNTNVGVQVETRKTR